MMKKFCALMLSFIMVLALTACGEAESTTETDSSAKTETSKTEKDNNDADEESSSKTDEDSKSESESEDDSEVSDDLLSFLEQLSLIEPGDDMIGVQWEFSGGMVDGAEMEQEDANQSLETWGGKLNIVFDDKENVSMIQGNGDLKGTYTITEDGYTMDIVFDNNGSELQYAGLFADVDGTEVFMLLPDDSGKNAIYFSQSSEE